MTFEEARGKLESLAAKTRVEQCEYCQGAGSIERRGSWIDRFLGFKDVRALCEACLGRGYIVLEAAIIDCADGDYAVAWGRPY